MKDLSPMKISTRVILIALILPALLMLNGCGDDMPNQYQSTLSEGIDFKREGYPNFIVQVSGVDGREDWGRWTNANLSPSAKFRFKAPLPKKFTLELQANPFAGNGVIPISIGSSFQSLALNRPDATYTLVFDNPNGSDLIEITPPHPITPKELNPASTDTRRIGVGLISLKIKEMK
jgi:phosphoglycerol transferase